MTARVGVVHGRHRLGRPGRSPTATSRSAKSSTSDTTRLLGEVIELSGRHGTMQVYEDTAGLAAGAPVFATGRPLEVELGPGLLGGVFDGLQRPLPRLAEADGDFLQRGHHAPALDRERLWAFVPALRRAMRCAAAPSPAPFEKRPRSITACSCRRASPASSR